MLDLLRDVLPHPHEGAGEQVSLVAPVDGFVVEGARAAGVDSDNLVRKFVGVELDKDGTGGDAVGVEGGVDAVVYFGVRNHVDFYCSTVRVLGVVGVRVLEDGEGVANRYEGWLPLSELGVGGRRGGTRRKGGVGRRSWLSFPPQGEGGGRVRVRVRVRVGAFAHSGKEGLLENRRSRGAEAPLLVFFSGLLIGPLRGLFRVQLSFQLALLLVVFSLLVLLPHRGSRLALNGALLLLLFSHGAQCLTLPASSAFGIRAGDCGRHEHGEVLAAVVRGRGRGGGGVFVGNVGEGGVEVQEVYGGELCHWLGELGAGKGREEVGREVEDEILRRLGREVREQGVVVVRHLRGVLCRKSRLFCLVERGQVGERVGIQGHAGRDGEHARRVEERNLGVPCNERIVEQVPGAVCHV